MSTAAAIRNGDAVTSRSVSHDARLARNLDRNAGLEKLVTDAQRARLAVPIAPLLRLRVCTR